MKAYVAVTSCNQLFDWLILLRICSLKSTCYKYICINNTQNTQWAPTRVKQLPVALPPYAGWLGEAIIRCHEIYILLQCPSLLTHQYWSMYQAGRCNFQWLQSIAYVLASAVAYCKQVSCAFIRDIYVTCACVGIMHDIVEAHCCIIRERKEFLRNSCNIDVIQWIRTFRPVGLIVSADEHPQVKAS